MILLNVDTKIDQWTITDEPERVEYGISLAATVLEYAFLNLIEAGFGTNAFLKNMEKVPIRIAPALGNSHRVIILENLARMGLLRCVSFNALLEQEIERNSSHMDYLLITAVVDGEMEDRIRLLRGKDNAVEICRFNCRERFNCYCSNVMLKDLMQWMETSAGTIQLLQMKLLFPIAHI